MNSVILILCFMPIVIIFIVMKLATWLSLTTFETKYIREEAKKPHGPYYPDAYADVDEEEEERWNSTNNQNQVTLHYQRGNVEFVVR